MLGGAGFERALEESWHADHRRGIRNVMKFMNMLEGEVTLPQSYLLYETVQRVNPRVETLAAPMDGYLAYWARDYPVRPR